MFIDTHCHLSKEYYADIFQVLKGLNCSGTNGTYSIIFTICFLVYEHKMCTMFPFAFSKNTNYSSILKIYYE